MPASSSETRTRWRKRRRESQIPRKLKAGQPEEDIFEDEDEEDEEFNEDDHNSNQNPSTSADRTLQIREMESVSDAGERIGSFPVVIKRAVSRPHSSVLSIVAMEKAGQVGESRGQGQNSVILENISHGQLQAMSAVPIDCPSLGGAEESGTSMGSFVITPPPIDKGRGILKRFGTAGRAHVVPMHADWFSPISIHRLERQVVPHFFSGKSRDHTPEKYMECRNCIVAKYMENPEMYLSVADCQKLVADVSFDDLTRIVRFLDHWGIINYCATAPTTLESRKDGTYLCEDSNGDLFVPAAALKSIDSLIQFDRPKCRLKAAEVYPELACPDNDDSNFDSIIREHLSETRCNYCSRPTPDGYYQSQKDVDVLLCLDCFQDGRYVVGHSSLDFVKVNSMRGSTCQDGDSWTDQETLLLLEGMQLYNENWNEIAEHVGTKSKAQCILHFVRLPVDGTPLENIEVPSSGSSNLRNGDDYKAISNLNGNLAVTGAGTKLQDSDFRSKFPFANCGNPVMALVAFLASAVGPRVGAACAHASLAELSKNDSSALSKNAMQIDGSRMPMEGMTGKECGHYGDPASLSQPKDEKLRGQSPWSQHESEVTPLSAEKVKAAATAGLAAAATKAKLFADHEEREIQRLSANIINHQLKRLELKLKQFAEVETLLMRECEQMERTRQRFAAERALMSSHLGSSGLSRPMGPPNAGPTVANNNVGNRQQLMSSSPQPFISGFGNNQPIHPHMSLLSQQSMYGLGPRLPLSAIQPSSSSSNIMFNAATNSQSALSHPTLRPLSGSKSGLG